MSHWNTLQTSSKAGRVPFSWIEACWFSWIEVSKDLLLGILVSCNWAESNISMVIIMFSSVQFSSVAQWCQTLSDPMNRSTPGLPVYHQLLSLPKLMSIELVMPSSHLILCHPLLLLPTIPPSTRVFSNITLHIYLTKIMNHTF